MKKLLIGLLLIGTAWSQQTAPYNIQLSQQPLPVVNNMYANYAGSAGTVTYYYWIVARYGVGNSAPSVPYVVNNVNPVGGGSISGGFSSPANPTGYNLTYDVLRTTTPNLLATGGCTACLLISNSTSSTFTDTFATLGNYVLNTYNPQPNNVSFTLDNINNSQLSLNINPSGNVMMLQVGGITADRNGQIRIHPQTGATFGILQTEPSQGANTSSVN